MNKQDAWIQTFSGVKFNVFDPKPKDIRIIDIAHALSNQCRFSGHVKRFYSVAEHSINVADCVPSLYKLKALLHDATEAYLVDIPSPIKPHLTNYKEIEDRLMKIIFKRFGLSETFQDVIHWWDQRMCLTEGYYLIPDISDWELFKEFKPIYHFNIKCMEPGEAKNAFITKFVELNERI